MVTRRDYICNLCSDNIPTGQGYGCYWETKQIGLTNPVFRPRITLKLLREAEHHICKNCFLDIGEAFAATTNRSADGETP